LIILSIDLFIFSNSIQPDLSIIIIQKPKKPSLSTSSWVMTMLVQSIKFGTEIYINKKKFDAYTYTYTYTDTYMYTHTYIYSHILVIIIGVAK